jgi:P-type Ca2+ transporter type 2C
LADGTVTVLIVLGVALQGRESDATARTLTFTSLVVGLLGLITVNRSWSRNILQILRSPNAAYRRVMVGATLFLMAVLYVPFLRSAFHFTSLSLQELGFAIAAGFAMLILLAGIKRFSVQSRERQRASSGP